MQKRLFLRLALAALLSVGMYALAAPAPAALAAAPTTIRMSGPSATANFFGQNGSLSWNVSINIYTQTTGSAGGTTESMRAEVFVSEFDESTGAGFFAATQCDETTGLCGVAAPEGTSIKLPASAYLPAVDVDVTPMGDMGPTGEPFTVHVGPISWSGEGGVVSHSTSVGRFPVSPTCDALFHQTGRTFNATATGDFSFTPPATINGFETFPVSVSGATTAFGDASLNYSGTLVHLFGEDCPSII